MQRTTDSAYPYHRASICAKHKGNALSFRRGPMDGRQPKTRSIALLDNASRACNCRGRHHAVVALIEATARERRELELVLP